MNYFTESKEEIHLCKMIQYMFEMFRLLNYHTGLNNFCEKIKKNQMNMEDVQFIKNMAEAFLYRM